MLYIKNTMWNIIKMNTCWEGGECNVMTCILKIPTGMENQSFQVETGDTSCLAIRQELSCMISSLVSGSFAVLPQTSNTVTMPCVCVK